jgi:exopolyphosphatase/guanosine-5'-triphosphate,3'-diphosphate pyrophosphatase
MPMPTQIEPLRREEREPDLAPGFPLRVGVVDMGSNAIRLMAAEFIAPATWTELVNERIPVRLGHRVYQTGRLEDDAIGAAVEAMARFADILRQLGIEHYRAVATSAVRESRNGRKLVERVRRETGLSLEVISGVEEARLVHWAARNRLKLGTDPWAMADLGGGSLEFAVVDADGVLASESHTIGSVRLLEQFERVEKLGPFHKLVEDYLAGLRLISLARSDGVGGFYATGGNMEDLAVLGDAPADEAGVRVLSVSALEEIIDELVGLTVEERIEVLGLRPDRADVILPAAIVYARMAHLIGRDEIHVPRVGVKEGTMLDLVEGVTQRTDHSARHERDVRAGAVAFGRRFMFDEAHGVHVSRLAEQIFDGLMELHGLSPRDREILQAAAVLHDIGQQIGYQKHHKHSYYLISHTELPGLSPEEVELVANVARYHRRASPNTDHDHYAALGKKDRKRVKKLASLLRLADALDREHLQKVHIVGVRRVDEDEVVLHVEGEGDLAIELWALGRKARLFERMYDTKVRTDDRTDRAS